MIKYDLYALPINETNLESVSNERFGRITRDYALIYSQSAPRDSVKLTDDDAYRLTAGDKQWLRDCNIAIIAEEMQENEADICSILSEQIDELEKRLKGVDKRVGER